MDTVVVACAEIPMHPCSTVEVFLEGAVGHQFADTPCKTFRSYRRFSGIPRCPQKVQLAGLVMTDESSMDAMGRYPGLNCRAKNSLKVRHPPRGGEYSEKECLELALNVTSVSGVSDAGVSIKVPKATLKRMIH